MSSAKHQFIEAFGWIASLMIVCAYGLTTLEIISPAAPLAHGLNLVGSIGVGAITYVKRAFQSVLLNVVWAVVALVGFIRYFVT